MDIIHVKYFSCFMASVISELLLTTGCKQLSVNETIPYEYTASEMETLLVDSVRL